MGMRGSSGRTHFSWSRLSFHSTSSPFMKPRTIAQERSNSATLIGWRPMKRTAESPRPMPIAIRPFDRSCSVAYALASTVGSRVAGFVTKWPSRIEEVSRAATASIGTDSCQRTWESYVHAYPKPWRSASWISSSQRENGGSGRTVTPKSMTPSLQLGASGDQVVAAGDELAHELVRRRAAAGHGQPVALVQVVAGLDLVVGPAQLLAELGLALDAHLQRLPLQLSDREHLPAHLEDRSLGTERERLLGAGELQAQTA